EIVEIDPESFRVARIERVLDVNKGCQASALLRLSNNRKCERCFAGRFGAENLHYSSTWKSADSERAVNQNISGWNNIDIDNPFPAQTHDRAFAIVFGNLLDGQIEILISRRGQFVSRCFFVGLCRHIRMTLSTTPTPVRQAEKRAVRVNETKKAANFPGSWPQLRRS